MRILISGSTGLIGSALVDVLRRENHQVVRLVRNQAGDRATEVFWDPMGARLDPRAVQGADAVIHLSGENVTSGRWTAAKKRAIRDSRIRSTTLLCETLTGLEQPPQTWLCASAIGFYGNRGDAPLTEDSAAGAGFLAGLCQEWEQATRPAAEAGIRVVNLRFGVVFSRRGGALKTMLLPFRLGLGGVVGDGRQYIGWIAIEDAAAAVCHALARSELEGPVNIVSPHPATNADLTRALGKALSRPTWLPMPAGIVRLAFGEMADEMLLASARVEPNRLLESGFVFQSPDLEQALRGLLA